jgi:tetratricopeptide (TPR) repeat protein
MTGERSAAAPVERAQIAVDIAYTDSVRALRLATAAKADPAADAETLSLAERAFGMLETASGDLARAQAHLTAAIEIAAAANLSVREAEARGSLGYVLSLAGRADAALAEIDRAAPALHGKAAAKLRMQRGLVLCDGGWFDEAAEAFGEALDVLADGGGDPVLEADIRNNRSAVSIHRRDWDATEDDLSRAEMLYVTAGHVGKTATVYHNRGVAAGLRGDLPAALSAYDQALERYNASGRDPGLLVVERAEALLSVLLVAEARQSAEQAIDRFERQHNALDLVQARLVLARAALLDGDHDVALTQATRARRSAVRQQRPSWAALAGYFALRAGWEAGRRTEAMIRAGRRGAADLAAAGWVVEAIDAQLIVARTAIELDRPALARRALAQASRVPDDGPAELRARACQAQALWRLAEGDRAGAEASLLAGMRILERFRASLGATELRVHASGHAGELARMGLRLALDGGNAAAVLMWSERWRAGALMLRPVRPVDDVELARDLAELRQVSAVTTATGVRGNATPGGPLKRQAALEQAVSRRARHSRGHGGVLDAPPDPGELLAALGETALVEYVAFDDTLHAVVIAGELRLARLGSVASVAADLRAVRHGLHRLAYEIGSAESLAAAATLVKHRAGRLDAVLLRPLREEIADRELVVVPTGVLHAMPWAVLPSCTGRPLSVAPSAALWHRAATTAADHPAGRNVFAAGPDLPHAAPEVEALARKYPRSVQLTGRESTVEALTRTLDGAGLAHIAAHGQFRADNPLFSHLRLVDGPLTVYDLERIGRPPRHVVLSACESGLSAVRPGDELLGLAGALLAMGTRSLIATVIPVPDASSRPLMLQLHQNLRAGLPPAAALASAQRTLTTAAAGFLCLGAG